MTRKPVDLRPIAKADIRSATQYCRREASASIALRFAAEVRSALDLIAHYPGAGTERYGQDADWPELRCLVLETFPFLIFYIEQSHRVRVVRVLHGRRDIPSLLNEFDS
jgi:toxin ParE1/3/4